MKKKQLFAGALAAAMMTASLAGCGGAASSAATSTTGGDTAGSTASADTNSGVVEVTIPSFKTGEKAARAGGMDCAIVGTAPMPFEPTYHMQDVTKLPGTIL